MLSHAEKYWGLLEASPDGILGVGDDGRIAVVNTQAEALFGYRAEELVGQPVEILVPEEARGIHRHHAGGYFAEPRTRPMGAFPGGVELAGRRKDGSEFPAEISLKYTVTEDGPLVWAAVRDVTARKEAERELTQRREREVAAEERLRLQAELDEVRRLEALGQLAGGVAHDFNNLLTVILVCNDEAIAALSARVETGAEEATSEALVAVKEVRAAAERAATLTRQLLTFARRDAGNLDVVDVNDVVVRLESFVRRAVGEHIHLRLRLDPRLWLTEIDPGHVEQIIVNLAVNARDAMPDGGTITIETTNTEHAPPDSQDHPQPRPGRYVRLAVTDTGAGMPPEVLDRACEPFFTTKPPGRGTGLGLATVYGIVIRAGGTIHLASPPGAGTTVTIRLPARTDTARPSPPPTSLTEAGRGETVLVVEDNDAVRRVAHRALSAAGYVVLDAALPSEALDICRRHPRTIDVLFTDIVMPEMSGPDLAHRVAAQQPATRIVYASGYAGESVADETSIGEVAFVQKPYVGRDLLEAIRTALDTPPGQR